MTARTCAPRGQPIERREGLIKKKIRIFLGRRLIHLAAPGRECVACRTGFGAKHQVLKQGASALQDADITCELA